jgi:hypothetical protein
VSNGSRRFGGGDGRSSTARRLRDLHDLLAAPARFDDLAEPTRQLIRRAALLSLEAEQMEARVTRGETIDAVAHATVTNTLSRLLTRLERAKASAAQPKTKSLVEYLADKQAVTA